ncbi:MAG TPA: hypothetical protein VEF03_01920 [Candidatus Binataceae bacterium]|nr:hypothetical protein [Candidatus Binataceae bacterium]
MNRNEADYALFRALDEVVASLRPEERAALDSTASDPAAMRHRERAIAHLGSELMARGMLEG